MVQPTSTTDFKTVPPSQGQCRLRIENSIPTDAGVIGFPEQQFMLASAGQTMTLTSPAGTYASIDFSADRFDIAPYPLPTDLTVDLPGAEFPAFSNVDVPELNLPTDFLASTGRELTNDTVFSWTPGASEDSTLFLRVVDFAADGKYVELFCRFADTGSFTLPQTIRDALTSELGADYSLSDPSLERIAYNIVTEGNALLVVTRSEQGL